MRATLRPILFLPSGVNDFRGWSCPTKGNHLNLGGEQARHGTDAVAEQFLAALMAIYTEHGGNLKPDQMLQATSRKLRGQLTGTAAVESEDQRRCGRVGNVWSV